MSLFKTPIIEFICDEKDWGVVPQPIPANKTMPDWYKKIPRHAPSGVRSQYGSIALTAKACVPLIDGMSLGYTVPLRADVNIRCNDTGRLIEAISSPHITPVVELHSLDQLGGSSSPTYPSPAIKFINPWVIKTAPGWSSLIIPPMNHFDERFTCLSAVVDTDKYHKQINFPAIWHMKDCDETLESGTPLVTVIPFKRSKLPKKSFARAMNSKEYKELDRIGRCQAHRAGYYTNELRCPR